MDWTTLRMGSRGLFGVLLHCTVIGKHDGEIPQIVGFTQVSGRDTKL